MSDSIISRAQAKIMVEKYQSSPLGSINPQTGQVPPLTRFVHFSLAQFFDLLTLNGIVTGSDTVDDILKNDKQYGMNVYLAQHADISDCPDSNPEYLGSNTVVIINTINKNSVWQELTESETGLKDIALDKGSKCPPECNLFENTL